MNQQQGYLNISFGLIWYYWFHKYQPHNNKATLIQVQQYRNKYTIECLQANSQSTLKKRIDQLTQKYIPTMSPTTTTHLQCSTLSSTSTSTPYSQTVYYLINPCKEGKQIQQTIRQNIKCCELENQQGKDMLNELYSYYINNQQIFIIYKKQKQPILATTNTTTSHHHEQSLHRINKYYQGSLINVHSISINSKIYNLSSLLNEDDSIGDRNDDIISLQDKIDNMEIFGKFADVDGLQLWNVKYYSIPHTYVKYKKQYWNHNKDNKDNKDNSISMNINISTPMLPVNVFPYQLHPCHPKYVHNLPLTPRLCSYTPSIDKLQPFILYMKQLWSKYPQLSPICQSIFQYNRYPYIFCQDSKQQSIAVLCYYIVYGNNGCLLSEKMVQRWMQSNTNTQLYLAIMEMRDIVRKKNQCVTDRELKGLFDIGGARGMRVGSGVGIW